MLLLKIEREGAEAANTVRRGTATRWGGPYEKENFYKTVSDAIVHMSNELASAKAPEKYLVSHHAELLFATPGATNRLASSKQAKVPQEHFAERFAKSTPRAFVGQFDPSKRACPTLEDQIRPVASATTLETAPRRYTFTRAFDAEAGRTRIVRRSERQLSRSRFRIMLHEG